MTDETAVSARRRWWLAAGLSLICPGLGQVYGGEPRRGILLYICFTAVGVLAMLHVPLSLPLGVLNLIPFVAAIAFSLYIAIDASAIARRGGSSYVMRGYNKWYIYAGYVVASSIAGGVLGMPAHMVSKSYYTPSAGMEDVLLVNDFLLVDRFAYNPPLEIFDRAITNFHRRQPVPGDIVVFQSKTESNRDLIKRCVATTGQVVEIVDKRLLVDGVPYPEPSTVKFTDSKTLARYTSPRDNFGPYTVPEKHFFALGDNRDNSNDSRHFGAVSTELAHGRASFIYWSSDPPSGSLDTGSAGMVTAILNSVSLPFRTRYSRLGTLIE
jgi:signal peptidase I